MVLWLTYFLQALLQRLTSIIVDRSRDTLDAATAGETADVRLGC